MTRRERFKSLLCTSEKWNFIVRVVLRLPLNFAEAWNGCRYSFVFFAQPARLLQHVSQFMSQQTVALERSGSKTSGVKIDIPSAGEGEGMFRAGGRCGSAIGVNSHSREIGAEAFLHFKPNICAQGRTCAARVPVICRSRSTYPVRQSSLAPQHSLGHVIGLPLMGVGTMPVPRTGTTLQLHASGTRTGRARPRTFDLLCSCFHSVFISGCVEFQLQSHA
jgi:hypothetical protein